MAVIYTPHFIQFFDNNGNPLSGGLLYTYAAGTTTPKATFTTAAGDVPNANPVVLDSAGRAVVFIDGAYKFRLETSAGVLVRETDNVDSFEIASASATAINWNTADTLASASTVDIGAATSNYVIITGTTTITSFGTIAQGAERILRFTGALQITHNATSMILPGGANITTQAGDTCRVISEGGGNWRMLSYQRASGLSLVTNPSINLGTEVATTSGTSIDFTSIPAGVKRITIMLNEVSWNASAITLVQLGDSGGIETTGYTARACGVQGGATGNLSSTAGFICATGSGFGAAETVSGKLVLDRMNATHTWVISGLLGNSVPGLYSAAGSKTLSAELDRVRFTTTTGTPTFDAGTMNISWEF